MTVSLLIILPVHVMTPHCSALFHSNQLLAVIGVNFQNLVVYPENLPRLLLFMLNTTLLSLSQYYVDY